MIPSFVYLVTKLVMSDRVGEWCRFPYPNHPQGCPNYGKAERCPPKAPAVGEYFDISRPMYLVHSEFDLDRHRLRMRDAHPQWSHRQCSCVLYWQSTSRKQLKERCREAMRLLGLDGMAMVPEAMGVNVYATARISGLILEPIRLLKTCRHVALIGHKKGKKQGRLF